MSPSGKQVPLRQEVSTSMEELGEGAERPQVGIETKYRQGAGQVRVEMDRRGGAGPWK